MPDYRYLTVALNRFPISVGPSRSLWWSWSSSIFHQANLATSPHFSQPKSYTGC